MMRWRRLIITATLLAMAVAGPLRAQDAAPATLIADQIDFTRATQVVTASGGVEIFYDGTRLRAASVIYDGANDTVQVQGPLTLTEANGRTILLADFAELSADLQNGVLRSARLVLDRQLQIAATEIERSDGRYTQLYQTVASSCEVCASNPVPLWEIRARRVIHDQQERQLYFENAQFRVAGVPIAYLPRLRLPDPTLERANGFLAPGITSDDELGTALQLPYFIMLGDHADVTITPWLTTGNNRTVELRYRQAFRTGAIEINSALTVDELTDDAQRGYLFADGQFALPRDYVLEFAIQSVTDPAYLAAYGLPNTVFLESHLTVSRAARDAYTEARVTQFASLRDGDDNETLPNSVVAAELTRRFEPEVIGGIASFTLSGSGYYRQSDIDGAGRDVARLSASTDWRRDFILPGGVLLALEGEIYADIYNTLQDSSFARTETRVVPFGGVELRWPLLRTSARGVSHLIEPVAQLAWSEDTGARVPNEDSVIVEFDEANLFALNRFPGDDRREVGQRLALALNYTRTDPLGWSLGLTAGRVFRDANYGQFTPGSGLDGTESDWLLAAHLGIGDTLTLINRALYDEDFAFTSNEFALNWMGPAHDLTTSYTWLQADPAEGRPVDMAEWAFDAGYDFANAWGASANWRYDFVANNPTRAGLTLNYATECVDVEFSVARRYTSTTTLNPATTVGLTVSLNGFGATRDGRSQARSCRR